MALGKDSVMYCAAKEEDSLTELNNDLRMSPIRDGIGPYLLLLLVVCVFHVAQAGLTLTM